MQPRYKTSLAGLLTAGLLLSPTLSAPTASAAPAGGVNTPPPVAKSLWKLLTGQSEVEEVTFSTPATEEARRRELAFAFTSTAEHSSMKWWETYDFLEDIEDGAGYTGGILGFNTSTGSMLELIEAATREYPENILAKWRAPLREVLTLPPGERAARAHEVLGGAFQEDWLWAASEDWFKRSQEGQRLVGYYVPAHGLAQRDGLGAIGVLVYYDALVQSGQGGLESFIHEATKKESPPVKGGDERQFLLALLDERKAFLERLGYASAGDRTEALRTLVLENPYLEGAVEWEVYGDGFRALVPAPSQP